MVKKVSKSGTKRGPDPMRSGEGRIFQAEEATMIGGWGGESLTEKQLGVGSVDPHAEPEGSPRWG